MSDSGADEQDVPAFLQIGLPADSHVLPSLQHKVDFEHRVSMLGVLPLRVDFAPMGGVNVKSRLQIRGHAAVQRMFNAGKIHVHGCPLFHWNIWIYYNIAGFIRLICPNNRRL
ncbi:hypothetical protein D3C74_304720 [compost metagenome]